MFSTYVIFICGGQICHTDKWGTAGVYKQKECTPLLGRLVAGLILEPRIRVLQTYRRINCDDDTFYTLEKEAVCPSRLSTVFYKKALPLHRHVRT